MALFYACCMTSAFSAIPIKVCTFTKCVPTTINNHTKDFGYFFLLFCMENFWQKTSLITIAKRQGWASFKRRQKTSQEIKNIMQQEEESNYHKYEARILAKNPFDFYNCTAKPQWNEITLKSRIPIKWFVN